MMGAWTWSYMKITDTSTIPIIFISSEIAEISWPFKFGKFSFLKHNVTDISCTNNFICVFLCPVPFFFFVYHVCWSILWIGAHCLYFLKQFDFRYISYVIRMSVIVFSRFTLLIPVSFQLYIFRLRFPSRNTYSFVRNFGKIISYSVRDFMQNEWLLLTVIWKVSWVNLALWYLSVVEYYENFKKYDECPMSFVSQKSSIFIETRRWSGKITSTINARSRIKFTHSN